MATVINYSCSCANPPLSYQLSLSIFGLKILYTTILLLLSLITLSSSFIAIENACSPHLLGRMWFFEPPSLPLSRELQGGCYHNSLPLRMEEVSTHTILHASCGIGAEQSLLLLLLRMGNGCWCNPIVLTENWCRMQTETNSFPLPNLSAVVTTVISTSRSSNLSFLVLALSLRSP